MLQFLSKQLWFCLVPVLQGASRHLGEGDLHAESVLEALDDIDEINPEQLVELAQSLQDLNVDVQKIVDALNAADGDKSPQGMFLINLLIARLIQILQALINSLTTTTTTTTPP